MTWIIISIPVALLAIAIAVLPVLLMSISEARRNSGPTSNLVPARPKPSVVIALENGGDRLPGEKAA